MDFSHIKCPKGVTLRTYKHRITIQIQFRYRGVLCREPAISKQVPDLKSASDIDTFEQQLKRAMKSASALLFRVRDEIELGKFDYSYHFPKSKKLRQLGQYQRRDNWTVGEYIDAYLKRAEKTIRPSTYKTYVRNLKFIIKPDFGEIAVQDLTAGMVRDWIHTRSLTAKRKTISNYLSPFKHALDDAVMDGVISINPVRQVNIDTIISVESRQSEFEPDPFTEEEIKLLLKHMDGQIRNIFQFAFYTGLRTNELIGLKWEKIDWNKREVLVDEAMVHGVQGELKTAGKGVKSRRVLLLDQAFEALIDQKKYTFLAGEYVFHNPLHDTHWENDAQLRKYGWKRSLDKSGVRYRNPYQTRHTFAHMHIRNNENIWWIANQMGHKGIEMLNQHYGGWLEKAAEDYTPSANFSANLRRSENRKN
ncbi:tyrosine-type recombinase/integrase [Sansalvadorimonas verongulae]|uniref:tyrosine-type recombinase/integrase n=1 Tax=Sansalvadorimonas verongulae TaxID=2172824 RepID=UPI0018AD1B11|nr:tyrosine-type recombinase/integrase [Sansalvadorimonas verongulae]